MEFLCQFGPSKVLFRGIPQNPQWPFWTWKLDSFLTKGGTPDLIVDYKNNLAEVDCSPIFEEVSGQVCRQFFVLADDTVLWQQKEVATDKLQLQFVVSREWDRITLTYDSSCTVGMGAFEALTFLIFYAFLHRQILTFHGAVVEFGGRSFLICANSGVGKTTHARLWRDCKNALVLNGDRATCYYSQGQWMAFGTPWCGTSGEYLNRCAPVKAVVILKRGKENRVSEANGMSLFEHVIYPNWDCSAIDVVLPLFEGFLKSVKVLQLECTPDSSAVEVLNRFLENL